MNASKKNADLEARKRVRKSLRRNRRKQRAEPVCKSCPPSVPTLRASTCQHRALGLQPGQAGCQAQPAHLRHDHSQARAAGRLAAAGGHQGGGHGEHPRELDPAVRVALVAGHQDLPGQRPADA